MIRAGLGRVALALGIALSMVWLTRTQSTDVVASTTVALSLIATGGVAGVFGSNRLLLRELAGHDLPSSSARQTLDAAAATVAKTATASVIVTTVGVGVLLRDFSPLLLASAAIATAAGAVLYLASDGHRATSTGWASELSFGRYGGAGPVWVWVLALLALQPSSSASIIALLAGISAVLAAPLLWSLMKRVGPSTAGAPTPGFFADAAPFGMTQVTGLLLQSADLWVGALLLESRELAFYAAARQLLMVVALPLQAAQLAFVAPLARAAQAKSPSDMQRIATRAARRAGPPAIAAGLVLLALPRQLLDLAFGSDYREAALALVILTGGQMFNALTGLCGQALSMAGEERLVTKVNIGAAAALPVLSLAGASMFGTAGLALAVASCTLGLFGALWWFARVRLGVETHLRLTTATAVTV